MPGRLRLSAASLLLAMVFPFSASIAATVFIQADKDNTLYQSATGTLSNGAGSYFFAGKTATGSIRRGLVSFDIAGSIPANNVIDSVTLRLHMSTTVAGAMPVNLHRVTASWGEGTSDATGEEGGGAASTTNDATWVHRFFNTVNWTTQGGTFAGVASATQSVVDTAFYTWSGAGLVSDVQSWLNTPANNFGWIVIGDESASGTTKRFDSSENVDVPFRPVLTVTYSPRVPAMPPLALPLLGLGMAAMAVMMLRRRTARG